MAANIFGDRFIGNREPAWHGLGQVFTDNPTAVEALQRAKLDYVVQKRPLHYYSDDSAGAAEVVIPDRFALVRPPTDDDPEDRVFGVVSDNYEVVQNVEVARFLEPLVAKWPVETAGALGYGETFFLTLRIGGGDIKGDPIDNYLLATDTKDGKRGQRYAATTVRTVCANTLETGLRSASAVLTLSHVQNLGTQLELAASVLAQAQAASTSVVEALNWLAENTLSEKIARSVLEKVYRAPKGEGNKFLTYAPARVEAGDAGVIAGETFDFTDPVLKALTNARDRYQYLNDRMEVYRKAAFGLFEKFNDELPNLANTGWALYNAVTECEDWRNGSTNVSERDLATSILFGQRSRTKARAFAAVSDALKS